VTKILVFGENPNDSKSLKQLILGLCPCLQPSDVKVLREPPTLQREAKPTKVQQWADRAGAVLRAAQIVVGEAICILVHSDSDGPDDGKFERSRSKELQDAGFTQAHAVVPVEAIESWWLLFPEATEALVPGWAGALPRRKRDVDKIAKPKDELIERTRRKLKKRPYTEADSEGIARKIVDCEFPKIGSSKSFDRFVGTVQSCCDHV
jgi:hypothetical protein